MRVTFPSYDSFMYRQVWLITERRNGFVSKTKPIGFCKEDQPMQPNELYSCLSTTITKPGTMVTLELMD